MDTPKPILPIVDGRRDFIEAHKKELIGIGVLSGILLLYGLYRLYRYFRKPAIVAGQVASSPTTVIVQQQAAPAPALAPPPPTTVIIQQPPPAAQTTTTQSQQQRKLRQAQAIATAQPAPSATGQIVKKQPTPAGVVIRKQTPRLPNAQQVKGNLPSTGNVVFTGYSPQYRLT